MNMLDKAAERKEKTPWPADIAAEFEREAQNPNPCVGTELLSENERSRVWIIRLAPGERTGFHRHVLDYFWTSVNGGRAKQHVNDGTTLEYTYQPGETRHETYGAGEFKVHDLAECGRPRDDFHDRRIQGQRQQADGASGRRPPTSRRIRFRNPGARCAHHSGLWFARQTSQAVTLPAHSTARKRHKNKIRRAQSRHGTLGRIR